MNKYFKHLSLVLGLSMVVSTYVAAQNGDPTMGLPNTSSDFKILSDLNVRAITTDQAWLYRVQARFNPSALPEKYRETTTEEAPEQNALNPQFLNEVAQALPKMSAEIQKALIPYLMPPAARAPVLNDKNFKSMKVSCPDSGPIPEPFPEGKWIHDDRDPDFRFWYVNYPKFGQDKNEWMISHALKSLKKAKIKYEALLGKQLLSDAGGATFVDASGETHIWCDGGNSKYDVYLNRFEDKYYGMVLAYPGKTSVAPSFMILDPVRLYGSEEMTEFTAAHELFHAFQFTHERNLNYKEYSDSDEGMANWAAHSVFPKNNSEHGYDFMSRYPEYSLLKRDYDSWAFYLYAVHENDENIIARILQEEVAQTPFQAMDKVFNGGLKKAFPEFSIKAWNKEDAIGPSFKTWDDFNAIPMRSEPKEMKLDNRGEFMSENLYKLPMGLTRAYEHYKIDPKVKSISLSWGKASIPEDNFHVRLLKKKDGNWITEDWDPKNRPQKYKFKETICFDDPQAEHFDEMLIVLSRSDFVAPFGNYWDGSQVRLRVGANNVPCYAVEGKGKYSLTTKRGTKGQGDYVETKYDSTFTTRFEAKRDADGRLTDRFEIKNVTANFNYSVTQEKYDPCANKLLCTFNKSMLEKVETCIGTKSGIINIDQKNTSFSITSVYTGQSANSRYYSFRLPVNVPGVDIVNVDCPKSADYVTNITHTDFQSMGASVPTLNPDGKIHGEWTNSNQGVSSWDFSYPSND